MNDLILCIFSAFIWSISTVIDKFYVLTKYKPYEVFLLRSPLFFIFGLLASWLFSSLQLSRSRHLVFGLSIVYIVYAISNTMGGSGLISCFVAGFVLNNRMPKDQRLSSLKGSIEPFNEAAELFLCGAFAFRVEPSYLLQALPLGLTCGLAMMLIARPASILIFNSLSNLNFRENFFYHLVRPQKCCKPGTILRTCGANF